MNNKKIFGNTKMSKYVLPIVIIIIIVIIIFYNKRKNVENFVNSNNIDIYYINLDRKKDRRLNIENELNKSKYLRNKYKRLSAIDGKSINIRPYYKYNIPNIESKRGWIGCAESHIQLWKKAYNENKILLIFEDDIQLKRNFSKHFKKIINNLPRNFDIVYLLTVNYIKYIPYNKLFYRLINKNFLLGCYILSPNGAKKLLDNMVPYIPYKQIDNNIVDLTKKNILDAFIYKEFIVFTKQDYSESDVQSSKKLVKYHGLNKI